MFKKIRSPETKSQANAMLMPTYIKKKNMVV